MRRLTIGKVAKLAGVGVETIRFYERKGLISRPPRGISGYREYSLETISRIRFIKRAQAVGFSLKEIKELLELREAPETNCQDIRQRTWSKIQEIEEKIARLQEMKRILEKLANSCKGQGPLWECPILGALEEEK